MVGMRSVVDHWWALAVRGVAAVLFGGLLLGLAFRLRGMAQRQPFHAAG